jgi:hypothetical protein
MTGNCTKDAGHLVASTVGAEEATANSQRGEGGRNPACRLKVSFGTADTCTAPNREKAVKVAACVRDGGRTDLPDSGPGGRVIDTIRIPSAAGTSAHSVAGSRAAAARCTASYSNALGLRTK